MDSPGPSPLVGVLVCILIGIGSMATASSDGRWVREQDDEVWVRWTVASNIDDKEELERGYIRFGAGYETIWGLDVYNNRSEPIYNVTLVPQVEGADLNLTLYETHAGDKPQHIYAFWGEIGSKHEGFVQEGFKAPEEPGAWTVRYIVLFETAEGENHYSVTTYQGEVVERETGPFEQVFESGDKQAPNASDTPSEDPGVWDAVPIGPAGGLLAAAGALSLAALSAPLLRDGRGRS